MLFLRQLSEIHSDTEVFSSILSLFLYTWKILFLPVCVTVCVCHKLFNEHLRKKIPGDFPGGSDGKMSAYSVGDPGSIPGS